MAHPGGRPKKYNSKKIIPLCKKYLESCIDEDYERIKSEGKISTSYDNLVKVNLPTIEGLSIYLGIARSTLYLWKEEFKEFSDIIEELMTKQAERLLNNSLSGKYNSTIAKLMLNKHGYIERQDIQQETKITGKVATLSTKDATEEEIDSFLIGQLK